MTPDERDDAKNKGLIILRPARNSRKKHWDIKKSSIATKTGWELFHTMGNIQLVSKLHAQAHINMIVKAHPDEYISEF
jgi:hypothetical protein